MLCSSDEGCCKNACFALRNIATKSFGQQRLVQDPNIDRILRTLSTLLMSYDEEIAKFAAMYVSTGVFFISCLVLYLYRGGSWRCARALDDLIFEPSPRFPF